MNDRRATLADVQAQVAVADAKAAPLRAAQAAAAARMTAAGNGLGEPGRLGAAARRPLARAAEPGLPAEPVPAVADAARVRGSSTTASDAAGTSGFSATGVASSHVRVALVLDRLAQPAVALERDARVEHERRGCHERNPVRRRHVLGDRRLRPERRCEMIDRINGRLALLLAIAGLLILRPGRLVRARLAPAVEGRGTRHADRRRERQARDDAGVPAEPGGAPERRGPPAPARRAPRRREDVRDPPAARVGVARERRQHHQHHAVCARSVDRSTGGADRPLGHRPLLPDREVHAPAPDAGRGQGRKGARVGAALRHRQHLVLERRQGA